MAATTISRATWTDGAAPTGTVINNARLQADIYDKIDTLLSSAITFGSTVSAEGFGNHLFSSGGTGANAVISRNTSAGTGNYAGLVVGNDNNSNLGTFRGHSSTYSSATLYKASGCTLESTGAGGLVMAASNASGGLAFLSANTLRVTVNSSGHIIVGSSATESAVSNFQLRVTGSNPAGQLCINGDGTGYQFAISRNNAGTVTNLFVFSDNGEFLPGADDSYSLGNASFAWNRICLANGSVSVPSVTFGNDTDTGLYTGGSGDLLFTSGGQNAMEITKSAAVFVALTTGAYGAGNSGNGVLIGANTSGADAAGALGLQQRGLSWSYLWSDSGTLRIHSAQPKEDDSVSHSAGTVVGTQTSSADTKTYVRDGISPDAALTAILQTPVRGWYYTSGAFNREVFDGITTDDSPWFGMDRDTLHPHGKSLNVINAIGYLVQAVKALSARLDALEAR